ncbi:MAG: hypothetical protein KatS3mg110_4630 [Pirellulaceae bacterium]|nr:MAG: hypothetical protein KatS3mg110_4630 [Pirellulaceae bacterium]
MKNRSGSNSRQCRSLRSWPAVRVACLITTLLLAEGSLLLAADQDPFQALIRPTEPLTPEQERQSFRLPPGFVIDLVAAEPDILKPLNMAFDSRGRLWVTVTQEYPFPAPPDRPGRDAVKILEDTDADGSFDKVITFADGLNIPIGVYPYRNGAIVFSIPHIWYLEDTDGDDVADRRTRLYGPMGYERDTHGMNNAFRRGLDGWLYACHGFNNETRVAGSDGHQIVMHSGNTYRMRVDGSRIEQFTWGQVNPFGMTMDRWFYLYTADCHSKPIYQLLRGGYYPSFGKPHDGLGFVPPLMEHLHGSTAIAGVVCYEATAFPEEYRGNFFSGNVMTSRVNRNAVVWNGTTPRLVEQPDFVITSDPWFRPVDLCMGPDGALYIADFYNRIIGHYEVPLDHPGRDRMRGRIWRVRYEGSASASKGPRADFSQADVQTLIELLADENLTRRLMATDQLSDRWGKSAAAAVRHAALGHESPTVRAHGLWVLFRLGEADESLVSALLTDPAPLVRCHAARVAAELGSWGGELANRIVQALEDPDPHVVRQAAEALGVHTEIDAAQPLLDAFLHADPSDALLLHTLRIALRNQCRDPQRLRNLARSASHPEARQALASIAVALSHEAAADWLLELLEQEPVEPSQALAWVRHAARYCEPARLPDLARWAVNRLADQPGTQLELITTVAGSLRERGADNPAIRAWAERVAKSIFELAQAYPWTVLPITTQPGANPWVVQVRPSADGQVAPFLCSLPLGETLTGRLRSSVFQIPQELEFYIAGHDGFPNQSPRGENRVVLVDAETGEVLREQPAPRADVAQRVVWDLGSHRGRRAYVELIDADSQTAYAWLAAGRFQPPVVVVPQQSPADVSRWAQEACRLAADLELHGLLPDLVQLSRSRGSDSAIQSAALEARARLENQEALRWLAVAVQNPELPDALRESLAALADKPDTDAVGRWLAELMHTSPAAVQQQVADALASSRQGGELLLALVERGIASTRLLADRQLRQRLQQAVGPARLEPLFRQAERLHHLQQPIEQLIDQRRQAVLRGKGDVQRGAAVFQRACAACHQLAGKGAVVGPQLDGIGQRGLARLLEDLLDPHRNVDVAFRTVTLQLADGRVLVALPRGDRGALRVFVDQEGKEFTVRPRRNRAGTAQRVVVDARQCGGRPSGKGLRRSGSILDATACKQHGTTTRNARKISASLSPAEFLS